MRSTATSVGRMLQRGAEHVAALLMATMFLSFLVTIVFRYVFNWPAGWAYELSIVCWLWGVLWGAAFVVREKEEIRFDVIYSSVRPSVQRVFAIVAGLALLLIYGGSFPDVADYVAFMKVESTAYLKIRFDWLYSIYVLFAAAVLVRYVYLTWHAVRGNAPDAAAAEGPGR